MDLYYEGGLKRMNYSISDTAEYGNYSRGPKVVGEAARKAMKEILADIQSGAFAREWIEEFEKGEPHLDELRARSASHPIEAVGANLRKMMNWLPKD